MVVYSIRRKKTFKIFDHKYLTSFIAYAKGSNLYIHLSRVDWEIPPRREDKLPEPRIGKFPSRFRIIPGTSMTFVDPQSVAVEWRDEIFSRPTRTRVTPGGELMRRTILMESPEEPEMGPAPPSEHRSLEIPLDTSPGTLRALADLEEQRQRGEISELEYTKRRREILAADQAAP